MELKIEHVSEVDSTNRLVKEALAHDCEEGWAVRADRQVSGYGRQGRQWSSPLGGMYLSVALRPVHCTAPLPTLSPVVALSVREAILSTGALIMPVEVKWPNDVVVPWPDDPAAYRKLCGISLEGVSGGLCVGIGLNVRRSYEEPVLHPENPASYRPVYLEDISSEVPSPAIMAESVLRTLMDNYRLWCAAGFEPFRASYESCDFLRGRSVTIVDRTGSPMAQGTVKGIESNASLLLMSTEGNICEISSGEAHLLVNKVP